MNQHTLSTPNRCPQVLKQAWDEYHQKNPKVCPRKAAKALNVSEAELVATGCGLNVTRLAPKWFQLLQSLGVLGPVMALTRNDYAVHEKVGLHRIVRFCGDNCVVLGDNIDMTVSLSHWHSGFAVEEANRTGPRRYSLQFFDCHGTSVHKVFLTKRSHVHAYHSLVQAFRGPDQSPGQFVQQVTRQIEHLDDNIDTDLFREHWRKLKTSLDIPVLQNKFRINRYHAMRLVENEFVSRVPPRLFQGFMQTVSELQLPVRVLVENRGVTQIHSGSIQKLRSTGPWFNVLDEAFSLHINEKAIASLWVVKWPAAVGTSKSLELYDAQGNDIALLFGPSSPDERENRVWRDLIASLPVLEAAA